MAVKATEHEKIARVHDVYQKLVYRWSSAEILEYAGKKWGVAKSQAYEYIAEARKRFDANCQVKEVEWVAQAMATLDRMARDELEGTEEGTTTGNRLAALQFIRTQAQFIKVI